jgi:tetratricopeptide (TPR) repeat protein
LNQGRNDLAETSLQNALTRLEESGNQKTPEAANALSNLGVVYMSQGKYTQAQEQLHKALSLREKGLKNAKVLIAATYNDLGLVHSYMNRRLKTKSKRQGENISSSCILQPMG